MKYKSKAIGELSNEEHAWARTNRFYNDNF